VDLHWRLNKKGLSRDLKENQRTSRYIVLIRGHINLYRRPRQRGRAEFKGIPLCFSVVGLKKRKDKRGAGTGEGLGTFEEVHDLTCTTWVAHPGSPIRVGNERL